MNSKICKKIRQQARTDFPDNDPSIRYRPIGMYKSNEFTHNDENGVPQFKEVYWTQSIRLNTQSTHGAYKQLKKYIKRYNLQSAYYG